MKEKLHSLQACRAIAALLVTLGHLCATAALPKYYSAQWLSIPFSFGHAGVEFFFVLSGFIIYHAHSTDINNPHKLWAYARKRTLRIYPIYLSVFFLVWIVAALTPQLRDTVPRSIGDIATAALLLPQTDLGRQGTGAAVLVVAWTLQYEMTFYVAFGLFIYSVWAGTLLLSAFVFITIFFPSALEPYRTFFTNSCIYLFLFGIAIGILFKNRTYILDPVRAFLYGLIGFSFVAGMEVLRFRGSQPEESHLSYGLFSALIIYGTVFMERDGIIKKFNPTLQLIGNSSYVLYLVHFPIASFAIKAFTRIFGASIWSAITCVLLTALATIATSIHLHTRFERKILAFFSR